MTSSHVTFLSRIDCPQPVPPRTLWVRSLPLSSGAGPRLHENISASMNTCHFVFLRAGPGLFLTFHDNISSCTDTVGALASSFIRSWAFVVLNKLLWSQYWRDQHSWVGPILCVQELECLLRFSQNTPGSDCLWNGGGISTFGWDQCSLQCRGTRHLRLDNQHNRAV